MDKIVRVPKMAAPGRRFLGFGMFLFLGHSSGLTPGSVQGSIYPDGLRESDVSAGGWTLRATCKASASPTVLSLWPQD